jgi:NAD(P)-dependent dehydrogenase (short-subunit alcohol dehydrogenase family)
MTPASRRTVAVTGSASGIGLALRQRLERAGERVIGVDLSGAEVMADLSSSGGRRAAIDGVLRACDGRLDGVVACAGIGPQQDDTVRIAAVNYFGAVAVLTGLRPALARGAQPAAVAVASNSATLTPGIDGPFATACLDGDETEARRLAAELNGTSVYAGSKLALVRWLRRQAIVPDWGGAGIRLNAVAPGPTLTPLLQAGLDHPTMGPAIRGLPIPLSGGFAGSDTVAAAIAFLLGPEASFCCGSILFVDGGTDSLARPDAI